MVGTNAGHCPLSRLSYARRRAPLPDPVGITLFFGLRLYPAMRPEFDIEQAVSVAVLIVEITRTGTDYAVFRPSRIACGSLNLF